MYQVITNDKFELPIYQADTAQEVAEFLGRHVNNVFQTVRENRTILNRKYRIIKIELDDED